MKFIIPPPAQNFRKKLLIATVCILISAVIGTILLWAVYHVPPAKMEGTLSFSAKIVEEEWSKPVLLTWCTSMLDNYTDAWMMTIAGFESGESRLLQAMRIAYPLTESGGNPTTIFISHYVRGEPYVSTANYSRYWHGYLVYLKPLLAITNYNRIRYYNAALHLAVLGILIYLMEKRGLKAYIPAFLISYGFLAPVAIMSSMQFSSCYYMLILGSIAILLPDDSNYIKYAPYLFLFIGIITVYFDFLTYPMVTLGIPAVLYCCRRSKISIGDAMKEGANICFFWGFGYVGMWASKWLLGSLILHENVLTSVEDRFTQWSSLSGTQSGQLPNNILSAISMNFSEFMFTPFSIIFWVFTLILLYQIVRRIRSFEQLKGAILDCFPYAVLALVPLAWYCVTSNHAMIHTFFTNKNLMVSVFAVLCALVSVNAHLQPPAKK